MGGKPKNSKSIAKAKFEAEQPAEGVEISRGKCPNCGRNMELPCRACTVERTCKCSEPEERNDHGGLGVDLHGKQYTRYKELLDAREQSENQPPQNPEETP